VADTQLPGVFGDLQPLLEHYGYLAIAVVAAVVITRRVRRSRAAASA
jgi:hypothetical protein